MIRGAKGYLIVTDSDPHKGQGQVAVFERDTFTCAHCNTIHTVPPRASQAESPGRCFQCDQLICKNCLNKGCTPFELKLEAWEHREKFLRDLQ